MFIIQIETPNGPMFVGKAGPVGEPKMFKSFVQARSVADKINEIDPSAEAAIGPVAGSSAVIKLLRQAARYQYERIDETDGNHLNETDDDHDVSGEVVGADPARADEPKEPFWSVPLEERDPPG